MKLLIAVLLAVSLAGCAGSKWGLTVSVPAFGSLKNTFDVNSQTNKTESIEK